MEQNNVTATLCICVCEQKSKIKLMSRFFNEIWGTGSISTIIDVLQWAVTQFPNDIHTETWCI